jgi:hypothetical protein
MKLHLIFKGASVLFVLYALFSSGYYCGYVDGMAALTAAPAEIPRWSHDDEEGYDEGGYEAGSVLSNKSDRF